MVNKFSRCVVTVLALSGGVQAVAAPVVVKEKAVQSVGVSKQTKQDSAAEEQARKQLSAKLDSLKSLSAQFEQTSVSSDGRLKTESGEMKMKRPALFRWNTQQPYEMAIIANGSKVWMVDDDLQQVIIQNQDERMANTPAQLLTGNSGKLLEKYKVVVFKSGTTETYTLTPKKESDLFEKLDLRFESNQLLSIELKDSLGGKRRIVFSGVKENSRIDDKMFKVKIPNGYDLIDETQG